MTPEFAALLVLIATIILQQIRAEQKFANSARELKASEARLVVSTKENAQKIEDNRVENESRNIDLLKESSKNYADALSRAAAAEALVTSLQKAQIADRELNLRSATDTQRSNEQHSVTQAKLDKANEQLQLANQQSTRILDELAKVKAGGETPATSAANAANERADAHAFAGTSSTNAGATSVEVHVDEQTLTGTVTT